MKGVLFLTLALAATTALAMPLCTGPGCDVSEDVANNMTTIIIKLGNDTEFRMMVPDHLSKREASWFLMMGKSTIDRAWARGLISKDERDSAIAKLKKSLDDLTDGNNAQIVAEALSEVFRILNGADGLNADIIIDLSNSSQIVIHVPDKISKQAADMIFEMGKQMIDAEVKKGTISKEKGEAAAKSLREQLDKLVVYKDIPNAEINIEVTKEMHIHLVVPDHLSKAQRDMIYDMGKHMIEHAVKAGQATQEQGDAALKKLKEELDKLTVNGEGIDGIEDLVKVNMVVVDDETALTNIFDEWWKQIIDSLTKKGWVLTAKLLNKYKKKVDDMFKKILKDQAKQLIDTLEKIRDDIITIIKGGHISNTTQTMMMNDEEMLGNPFDDLWKKIIDYLNKKGHYGQLFAKLLNKYKGKIEDMFKKILKNEATELIKLIEDMKNDIITIIKGGHISNTTQGIMMDDEEILFNIFDDLWAKMIKYFQDLGKGGKIFAKLLNKYKGKIEDMFKKILKNEATELIKLIEDMKNDIITIIKGGHISNTTQGIMMDDEEILFNPHILNEETKLGNFIEKWWNELLAWLETKGHVGHVTGKLLIKYRRLIGEMFAKILKTQVGELVTLIESVRDDIIVIIKGGHIKPLLRLLW